MLRSALLVAAQGATWLGLGRLARRARRARGDFRVYVLEYHGVDPFDRESEGTIGQDRFRRHVEWLQRHFEILTLADAVDRLRSGLEGDVLAITFDDGYANNVEGAFPVLFELGVPATFYLATGFLDGRELWFDAARRLLAVLLGPEPMTPSPAPEDGRDAAVVQEAAPAPGRTGARPGARLEARLGEWPPGGGLDDLETVMKRLKSLPGDERLAAVEDLRELASLRGLDPGPAARPMTWEQARVLGEAGMELGAHTVSHPILSRLDRAAQAEEIAGSRARLAEELGAPPRTFAIPNGSVRDYDHHTLELVRELGFEACCTTRRGSNRPDDDPMELRRLGVGSDSIALLDARLAGLLDEGLRRFLRQ